MKVGFKTGPKTWEEGKKIINQLGAEYCELWFRYDQKEKFKTALHFLQKKKIHSGLHFWAQLPDGTMPNLAFDSERVLKQTREMIQKTIDIAASYHFDYVVVHPGSRKLVLVDLEKCQFAIKSEKLTPVSLSDKILLDNCLNLDQYARQRGVVFLIETLSAREPRDWRQPRGRFKPLETFPVSFASFLHLAKNKILIANDLAHTTMMEITNNRQVLWEKLFEKTKKLAWATRLVHVNTLLPPFNGTDSHGGLLAEDFRKGVFPDRGQLKKILTIFSIRNRSDLWLIPEPKEKMAENYLALKELAAEISQ